MEILYDNQNIFLDYHSDHLMTLALLKTCHLFTAWYKVLLGLLQMQLTEMEIKLP